MTNIVVLIKQVPDTWSERKLTTGDFTLDREAADAVLDEINERAVEAALLIKEKDEVEGRDGKVVEFDIPGERHWEIPVSDMQAYKQFGNAVVPQVVEAVARAMKPAVLSSSGANDARPVRGERLVLPPIAA